MDTFKNTKNTITTETIDGRKLSKELLSDTKKEVDSLSFRPIFCDVLVGNDPASIQYVNMKKNMAEKIGISFHEAFFPTDIKTEDLIKEIKVLNKIPDMCGIIIQLPLPEHLNEKEILDAVDSNLDVDCLSTIASNKFYKGDYFLGFPTALACIFLLDSINLNLNNKKIVVLGNGKLVGKPVSSILRYRNLNFKILSSSTENNEEILKEADVVISGMGNGKYIKGNMIKAGAIIIDAGTSELNAGIVGDVDLESVKGIASFVSPVPGGVGPMTIAMLFSNVLKVAKNKSSILEK
ncbi:MAG: Bifunctional protein FolD [Candidatus Nomurabacteria bacterium GW2011_GWE1_32_28]|uniref:Bifunctional protein FolD n=1 Tax=Candidatus Nomurabacteria bacterium GW2011_GWF1_31_48 TaxID=1618767 RepID=A0A0F9YG33_9BACT|nr:MAG: Bifunctional protein FolD [Candidatus Nomurabacteria bacterium GW2011_GWF2_30_133]KKP29006.1 MAG: Bifunctional protein FolD [Candidatus Nomurabacteria bacterium GW2011_GWE2_31_40]KKP30584.1 MAG: Bifunctional protein FolD [Candidatus Nomurabacteria bacterium GW2011_GWF1_31_48]KKP35261.1 MAG: Bifunctional protein FolD [Candidatus Nomurabacteria bacterium GW2011_GWE1_32_28]HAS80568.1 bifunctional methylenetetrahydrofolate dehydrogenase/methenyltetrahydrofolate cyclohydrolase [Candidatus No